MSKGISELQLMSIRHIKNKYLYMTHVWASFQVALVVTNLHGRARDTRDPVWSLGWEDPPGEGKSPWQPTPVFLPGKSHGQRSLVGCSPWGCEELDTTECAHTHTNHLTNFQLGGFASSGAIWQCVQALWVVTNEMRSDCHVENRGSDAAKCLTMHRLLLLSRFSCVWLCATP